MTNNPFVSIIIPVKKFNAYLEESLGACLRLDYFNFEIIVLPDEIFSYKNEKVRIIPTGPVGPSAKRDLGAGAAAGEILAFIDDDVFPAAEWLKNGAAIFEDSKIAAVGGPAVTPPKDDFFRQVSGLIFSSPVCSGGQAFRYRPGKARFMDDFPSCNFLVRKSIFEKIGGFDNCFWPGEDTLACLKITRDLKEKIYYSPDVLVYHHRRPVFRRHLEQAASYARHRGYFVKKFPANSLRLTYFLPSFWLIFLIAGLFFILANRSLSGIYAAVYAGLVVFYLALVLIFSLAAKNILKIIFTFVGIILTHLTYGLFFMTGLFSKRLKEEVVPR